jgi:PAS domain S-box-containing protein
MNHSKNEKIEMLENDVKVKPIGRESMEQNNLKFESKPKADALSIVYDAIDSTVGGIIITDTQGKITYVNPSFLRMFGYRDKSEVIGMNAALLFPGDEIRHFADVEAVIDVSDGATEEFTVQTKDGEMCFVEVSSSVVRNSSGKIDGRMASFVDITRRKQLELEQQTLIQKLQDALEKIKTLRGLIPICAACKNIRDDQGFWHHVEEYISKRSDAKFSHGVCPDCMKKIYPEVKLEESTE